LNIPVHASTDAKRLGDACPEAASAG
jgi:hypothetical protein